MARFLSAFGAFLIFLWILVATAEAARFPVDSERIRAALEESWRAQGDSDALLEIRSVPSLVTDDPAAELEITWPEPPVEPGRRAVPIGCRVGDRIVARGLASVVVRRNSAVWVLQRDVARGETISAADVRKEDREWSRPPVRFVSADPPANGWIALRTLPSGGLLRRADVSERPDVEAGREIHLISRAGDAVVTVPVRVRRRGNVGDTILVHNPITGEVVRAVLRSPETAELVTAERERSDS